MKVAVLFGGDSMERDVSVASAAQVVRALRSRGHIVLAVDVQRGLIGAEQEAALLSGIIDSRPPRKGTKGNYPALTSTGELSQVNLVFLAMHGGSGEDGTIQAMLELADLPFTGSGRLASAIGMDKDISKRLFLSAGVPTPDWLMTPIDAETVAERLGFPVIVKPNGQGSTVGLTLVEGPEGLCAAIEHARQFDKEVMIERYIPGRELTVGILEGAPLAVGEIIPTKGDIFDYEAKYQIGGADEIFPADIDSATAATVRELARRASDALKIACYCRVDFRMDPDGGLWCLEANTLPGLTAGSLLPRSAAAVGIGFAELCERICECALRRVTANRP